MRGVAVLAACAKFVACASALSAPPALSLLAPSLLAPACSRRPPGGWRPRGRVARAAADGPDGAGAREQGSGTPSAAVILKFALVSLPCAAAACRLHPPGRMRSAQSAPNAPHGTPPAPILAANTAMAAAYARDAAGLAPPLARRFCRLRIDARAQAAWPAPDSCAAGRCRWACAAA